MLGRFVSCLCMTSKLAHLRPTDVIRDVRRRELTPSLLLHAQDRESNLEKLIFCQFNKTVSLFIADFILVCTNKYRYIVRCDDRPSELSVRAGSGSLC